MAVGEPDFPAPALVRSAAIEKVKSGDVRYTPAAARPGCAGPWRTPDSHARNASRRRGDHDLPQREARALGRDLRAGSRRRRVLIPLPGLASYFDIVRVAGARRCSLPPSRADGVRPDLEALARAVTPKTRA